VADLLRNEPDTEVQMVDGKDGELTVLVNGREVARKEGGTPPDPQTVVDAVRAASGAAATR
jgi:hypothetical protein